MNKNMTDFTKWILNAPLKEINQYTI
ncbi:hypothetical protein [Enterococcus saigonensis]